MKVRAPSGTATVGARTEHIKLIERPVNGTTVGLVQRLEHLGDQSHLHLRIADRTIVMLVAGHSPLKQGDPLGIELMQPLFFDSDGRRLAPAEREEPRMTTDDDAGPAATTDKARPSASSRMRRS